MVDEGRHCMDHDTIHLAYCWYVREKRSSEPEVFVIRGSAPRVDYLCNAAYSRLPQAEKAEWTLLESVGRTHAPDTSLKGQPLSPQLARLAAPAARARRRRHGDAQ